MAWATRTIYTSKCVQIDPHQLLKMYNVYSICNKCVMQKTVEGVDITSGSLRVKVIVCMSSSVCQTLASVIGYNESTTVHNLLELWKLIEEFQVGLMDLDTTFVNTWCLNRVFVSL